MQDKANIVCLVGGAGGPLNDGVADYSQRLANALKNAGVTVISASTQPVNLPASDILPMKSWRSIRAFWQLAREAKSRGCKITHLEYPLIMACGTHLGPLLFPLFAKLQGLTTVLTLHEYETFSWKGRFCIAVSMICADAIISVDPTRIRKLPPFLRNKKTCYIPITSSIPDFESWSNEAIAIVEKGRRENRKAMCFFGLVGKHKCFKEIIDAMGQLKDEGSLKSFLVLLGSIDRESEYGREALGTIQAKLSPDDYVETGYLSPTTVSSCLRACDFAIFPFAEGVSVRNSSFLAAYKEGLEIITTTPKQEFPYEDVRFVPTPLPELLAAEIAKIQKVDTKHIQGENRKRRHMITWQEIANRHLYLYESLVKQ